ncbi:ABC transporter substrate-binding protein [Aquihabitans sp. G128]|uniref:ABC transporter substrate-binding protein n=1 Tax=Aquihabitans sp. G128 TaxID=2849779 RepID=UPI001C23075D|nr:ABC transporter substrate-binding protein [Aquihabitans sp. G128]QXC62931.1 ABC transporter substrate-binding protein [Aquihabitans sp. G128]
MKTRVIALCCILALLASACGSRLSDGELATGGGTGSGSAATSSGSATDGPGITKGSTKDEGPKVGTLDVPCGMAADGKASTKAPAGDVPGVTADKIKIAVISDRAGQVKVPTISIEESMKAFVGFCNEFGGINGRKLELTTIDSKLFNHLEATKEACNDGVFAIVGSGSVTDNSGAQAMVDCKLIEVPAYTVTAAKSLSDRLVAPLPNPTTGINIGPALYIKKEHPKAIKKAAILHGGIDAIDVQADRIKKSYEAQGFDFTFDKRTGVIQESYTSEVKEMKDKGIEYVTMVSATSEVVKVLRDMKTQGFSPEVIDLGQQYYDPDLLKEPGAEGALVQLNTVPFEEEKQSPALQAYLAAYDKVSGDKPEPSSLGVQSYSAGLLFATAAKAAGPDLTRDSVLAELKKIKKWDGGGLHFTSDPGDNAVSTCFMYDVVKGGKFTRLEPKKATEFTCDKDYAFDLDDDYGGGAKVGG